MKVNIVSSTKDKTVSGKVVWGDGSITDLGTKPAEEYIDNLTKVTNPKFGLLPPAVRWISNNKRIVVFERPPTRQRVAYYELDRSQIAASGYGVLKNSGKYPEVEFSIPLPWTVYVLGFGFDYQPVSVRVYMRKQPLSSMNSSVYLLPLLNFYTNSKLCNPIFEKFENTEVTLSAGIHNAYNTVWNSGFNFDLMDAAKSGISCSSPFKSKSNKLTPSPSTAFGTSIYSNTSTNGYNFGGNLGASSTARSLRLYFSAWEDAGIDDILNAKMINPSVGDNNSEMDYTIHLRDAIQRVHEELSANMGSTNIAKNFMTSLVNNFNAT